MFHDFILPISSYISLKATNTKKNTKSTMMSS